MKPINEMSINECLWVICNPMDVTPQYTSTEILKEIADRIHELTRWIPVEERLPTEEDAYPLGEYMGIEFWSNKFGMKLFCTVARFNQDFIESNEVTHWRRIDKPEGTL